LKKKGGGLLLPAKNGCALRKHLLTLKEEGNGTLKEGERRKLEIESQQSELKNDGTQWGETYSRIDLIRLTFEGAGHRKESSPEGHKVGQPEAQNGESKVRHR